VTDDARPTPAYLAPDIWIEALKGGVAAIRCMAAYDQEGLGAIVNGNEHPGPLVAAIAAIAAGVCRQGGLDDAGIAALLPWIASQLTDLVLDQEKPAEGGGSHR
jgi:hypothetical protein